MRNENSIENVKQHEAAEGHPPAASASEIMNRENPMSRMWPFMGGVLVGAAGVVTAALVADRLAYGEGGLREQYLQRATALALPEGKEDGQG